MNLNSMGVRVDAGWANDQRRTTRQTLGVPGRLVWKDARGATRFNSVVIRDVSDTGAYVESVSGAAIPLYRLVSLQAERDVKADTLPALLRQGRVLSAVFGVGPSSRATGTPEGYDLRLLVEPRRRPAVAPLPMVNLAVELAEATA
jgi:hypothetical protein